VWPLSVGVAKRANQRNTCLPHRLNRLDGVPETDVSTLVDGSAGGGGATRDGVGKVSGVVVHGTSGPWGQPVNRWRSSPFGGSPVLQQGR
jgi:hypothetical protein